MSIDRQELLKKLKYQQEAIVPESSEDEGAAEHYAEIQSVIDVIEKNGTDEEIQKARDWVGV